jgi:PAS domain S-box-containing protein
MSSQLVGLGRQADLRLRALSRLNGGGTGQKRASASDALGVLFELASSPSTADDALALLHELQVHQVELELQDEELRSSRAELEAALSRQIELYDASPVGCFTVDARTVLCELNLTGARLLGFERAELLGRALDDLLAPRSADTLHTLLARAKEGHHAEACQLELLQPGAEPRMVHASAAIDPSGQGFLIAFSDIGGSRR